MRWTEITETQSVKWTEPKSAGHLLTSGEAKVVTLSLSALDRSWSQDADHYIGGPESKNAIRNRYAAFGNWLEKGEAVEMPELTLDHYGNIFFVNGRHRTAYLRDQGLTHIQAVVPAEQADEITRRFG